MTTSHAGAVAFREVDGQPRFLVITSSDGAHWVLPKGHIEPRESPSQAALRELKEEAGVIGKVIKPLSLQRFRRKGQEAVVQYYLVRAIDLLAPDEMRLLRWESAKGAFERLTFEEARNALSEGAAEIANCAD